MLIGESPKIRGTLLRGPYSTDPSMQGTFLRAPIEDEDDHENPRALLRRSRQPEAERRFQAPLRAQASGFRGFRGFRAQGLGFIRVQGLGLRIFRGSFLKPALREDM